MDWYRYHWKWSFTYINDIYPIVYRQDDHGLIIHLYVYKGILNIPWQSRPRLSTAAGQGSSYRTTTSTMWFHPDREFCYGVKLSMNYGCHIFLNTSHWILLVISSYIMLYPYIPMIFPLYHHFYQWNSHLFYMFRRGDSQWRRLFGPRTKIRRVRLQKKKGEDSYLTMEKTRWSYDV